MRNEKNGHYDKAKDKDNNEISANTNTLKYEMILKKGSSVYRIETDREGLYLGPTSGKGFETVGNGLNLTKQGALYDGRGLILGPNSLGMIL